MDTFRYSVRGYCKVVNCKVVNCKVLWGFAWHASAHTEDSSISLVIKNALLNDPSC